jgi:hypothetical protein
MAHHSRVLSPLLVDELHDGLEKLLGIRVVLRKHRTFGYVVKALSRRERIGHHPRTAEDFLPVLEDRSEMPPSAGDQKGGPPG